MHKFARQPKNERQVYFEQVAARRNLPASIVEKDFWVCWTLMRLFSVPDLNENLTFKGGTSLSKAWGLIQRFSEDIDLVISRGFFGFEGEDSPERAPSRKQRDKRLDDLRQACSEYVKGDLYDHLFKDFEQCLPANERWNLSVDKEDIAGQSLLFAYPCCWDDLAAGYVRPEVKIELGARGDPWPSQRVEIRPFVGEEFPAVFEVIDVSVQVLSPERTFWEKAMLIHEEMFRPADKPRKPRMARHYYDLWCLAQAGIAQNAIRDLGLFQSVASHRQVFFRQNWVDYSTLTQGSLKLIPEGGQMEHWRRDYEDMEEMFYGGHPSFDDLLPVIQSLQVQFNSE